MAVYIVSSEPSDRSLTDHKQVKTADRHNIRTVEEHPDISATLNPVSLNISEIGQYPKAPLTASWH